jgi:hypothetical protein
MAQRGFKAAAACLVGVILVATGWAAEQVYQKVAKKYFVTISAPTGPAWEITTPEGTKSFTASGVFVAIASRDPSGLEVAREHHEEVKSLIPGGKYEFVRTFESAGQPVQYVYRFKLSNGQEWIENFAYPLEKVTSWEDYLQKAQQQQVERDRAIYDAISKGDFRLLDIDLIKQHVCRDASTGQKLAVLQVHLPDGTKVAMVQPYPLGSSSGGYETSWAEHLREITDGRMTLADGSKTVFSYGGQEPLVKGSEAHLVVGGASTGSP